MISFSNNLALLAEKFKEIDIKDTMREDFIKIKNIKKVL